MNARQKAKYWKRRYQQLAETPLPTATLVTTRNLETIAFHKEYSEETMQALMSNPDSVKEMIQMDLERYLAEHLMDYVEYKAHYVPEYLKYVVDGRINVIRVCCEEKTYGDEINT